MANFLGFGWIGSSDPEHCAVEAQASVLERMTGLVEQIVRESAEAH